MDDKTGRLWVAMKEEKTMDQMEKAMIAAVNRNHDCRVLADRLNAISARRRRKRRWWQVYGKE